MKGNGRERKGIEGDGRRETKGRKEGGKIYGGFKIILGRRRKRRIKTEDGRI